MKKVCQIKLNTINEVKEFVNIVLQCPYDVDLVSGRYIIDAKSLMGIFSLDLTRPIGLEADIDSDDVEDLLKKIDFCVVK
ncbi:MAG TPA: HPr family phosphocarrier protein [Candidatus Faecivivens stercoravium]|uniref:HPr family phosphocarrier protein n=1 Tax=Candidatus Faecivivens stercoravium TaxID=2840803 RepID=A0A9D1DVN5_9FIRM|nr:HPr family phosphocarrier protein [Candidatus Faecivivens stercoravium]